MAKPGAFGSRKNIKPITGIKRLLTDEERIEFDNRMINWPYH